MGRSATGSVGFMLAGKRNDILKRCTEGTESAEQDQHGGAETRRRIWGFRIARRSSAANANLRAGRSPSATPRCCLARTDAGVAEWIGLAPRVFCVVSAKAGRECTSAGKQPILGVKNNQKRSVPPCLRVDPVPCPPQPPSPRQHVGEVARACRSPSKQQSLRTVKKMKSSVPPCLRVDPVPCPPQPPQPQSHANHPLY
jgi:hypothetical protein